MNATVDAQNKMKDLIDKKEELIDSAAKIMAQALISCNQRGVTKLSNIQSLIGDMTIGFTDEEKIAILIKAAAITVVNL